MCWRRIYRVLDSWIVNTIQDLEQKLMHLLMGTNTAMLFPSRGVSIFGLDMNLDIVILEYGLDASSYMAV